MLGGKDAMSKVDSFAARGHGISEEIIADAFMQNKAFFALPLEQKLRIAADKNFRGYTAMHVSSCYSHMVSHGYCANEYNYCLSRNIPVLVRSCWLDYTLVIGFCNLLEDKAKLLHQSTRMTWSRTDFAGIVAQHWNQQILSDDVVLFF